MREQPQMEFPETPQPDRSHFSFALLVAAAAFVIALAGFYFLPGRQSPSRGDSDTHAPFGPGESAYASKIRVENLALSHAENFLNQEVIILSGQLINDGDRGLAEIELTIEFYDAMNQVVLRESRLALAPPAPALPPGGRGTFDISFEHMPAMWNVQLPAVRVSGILFAEAK